jgi:hypothetical protein
MAYRTTLNVARVMHARDKDTISAILHGHEAQNDHFQCKYMIYLMLLNGQEIA